MEQFLKDAGADRIHEKAVVSLEKELNDTVKQLVEDAQVYANYAGRKRIIKRSDIALAGGRRKEVREVCPHKEEGHGACKADAKEQAGRAVARYPAIVQ